MSDPDQIDMMSPQELRTELRRLVENSEQLQKENESLRFEIANSTKNTCLVCDNYIPECECIADAQ